MTKKFWVEQIFITYGKIEVVNSSDTGDVFVSVYQGLTGTEKVAGFSLTKEQQEELYATFIRQREAK